MPDMPRSMLFQDAAKPGRRDQGECLPISTNWSVDVELLLFHRDTGRQ